ncbi:hypothetical protein B0H34DRAFT_712647 [Crassisporium funariophilum]|nr:hypothetical protein B0H34DRAFT_712647 [Crassisporium funariophilum]
MAPNDHPVFIDHVLHQITTTNNIRDLNHVLKNGLARETKEAVLASSLSSGQDPLTVLDVQVNTLGVLYILSARVSGSSSAHPPWGIVQEFCRRFNPEHARLAPDRITKLAKGIQRMATHYGNPSSAITPLSDLVTRYPPNGSYLTTIHPIFLLTCVTTRNFLPTLPVLAQFITNVDTSISPDLHYTDNLAYHYTGGVALAALKRWREAEEYFEICVTSPGTYPAALQMEALKKLRLVQLISTGKISNLPKYTHPLLIRLFKNTSYQVFINAYPHNVDHMREIYEKERSSFTQDKNMGLLNQAIARAPRWVLKKLTATYVTLHLSDIGRAIRIEDEDEVRALLLSMIEANDISAQISAEGTVTFSDPLPQFTKAQVDTVLKDVQEQTALLASLEQQVGRSKDFLSKAAKPSDPEWAHTAEEEIFGNLTAQHGMWDENVYS